MSQNYQSHQEPNHVLKEAYQHLKELDLQVEDEEAWDYWAYAKFQQGKLDEAKKGYMENIKLDPTNDTGIYNLACIFSLQKDVQSALKYLKKAIYMDDFWVDHAKNDKDFQNIQNHLMMIILLVSVFRKMETVLH